MLRDRRVFMVLAVVGVLSGLSLGIGSVGKTGIVAAGLVVTDGLFSPVVGTATLDVNKLLADGDLDPTFGPADANVPLGVSRKVFGTSAASQDIVYAMGLQTIGANAGKIVAAGVTQSTTT